jgi:arginine-tRNA-protein transferase
MATRGPFSSTRRLQPLHVLTETPCPYLPGRMERKVLTVLERGPNAVETYSTLSHAGYRRSQRYVYQPACRDCCACLPVRVAAFAFAPSRNQKRVLIRNRDLTARLAPPEATQEQYGLFQRYLDSRHGNGEMSGMTGSDYRNMVEDTPVSTAVAEFRDSGGALLACLLLDWLDDGPSLVYSFFEPKEERRSLGTHIVLWAIEEAARRGLPYVYLGYWIRECRKMSYKSRFRPLEALREGRWQPVTGTR